MELCNHAIPNYYISYDIYHKMISRELNEGKQIDKLYSGTHWTIAQ